MADKITATKVSTNVNNPTTGQAAKDQETWNEAVYSELVKALNRTTEILK